jgi:hypothetical protein
MASSIQLQQYLIYAGRLGNEDIAAASGAIISRLPPNQPVPRSAFAQVIEESLVHRMQLPLGPITKMAKLEHVDAFFSSGRIRLGTFNYFNGCDHEEVTDVEEGRFILVGRSSSATAFAQVAGGFDHYAFCCYSGAPDPACIKRFGYDSAYIIRDPSRFAQAINDAIQAQAYEYAACVYSANKVVVADVPEAFDFQKVSAHLLNLTTSAKFYVKPEKYSHQMEFRFLWRMPSDIGPYLDLACPEAVSFCERP